jgi:hypothetical protein
VKPNREIMDLNKENSDELMNEDNLISGHYTYERAFSMPIAAFDFDDRIFKGVMKALDPFLGIATVNNNLNDVLSNPEYNFNKFKAGVHNDCNFYNKPGNSFNTKYWGRYMDYNARVSEFLFPTIFKEKIGTRAS